MGPKAERPSTTLPLLMAGLPLVACVASAVPTAFLKALAGLEAAWPFATPAPMLLRFGGATALVVGHATSVRTKPALSAADWGYLTGVSCLSCFFGSLCVSKWLDEPAFALPPLVVSLGGLSMLCCFGILARNALASGVTAMTRAAVVAAIAGSAALVTAGLSEERRLFAATIASSCFLFANSVLLLLLARAKTSTLTTLAQFAKVSGSLSLLCANSIALEAHADASLPYKLSGVLGADFITAVATHTTPALCASFIALLGSGIFATAYYL